jgi:hypothetical protein
MKMLHALVAYLAVITPFAFAHPLAASIDHDGFVNTRQNRNDGDLEKRVPGDIIEARQLVVVDALLVIDLVAIVGVSILLVEEEDAVRGNEEEFLVDHFD